jgi:hypothetical protein
MRTPRESRRTALSTLFLVSAILGALVCIAGGACTLGGDEGDVCNPLVLRDECNSGLHCKAASCTTSYCCPVDGSSSDPNCNAPGCPDTDGGSPSDAGDAG